MEGVTPGHYGVSEGLLELVGSDRDRGRRRLVCFIVYIELLSMAYLVFQ